MSKRGIATNHALKNPPINAKSETTNIAKDAAIKALIPSKARELTVMKRIMYNANHIEVKNTLSVKALAVIITSVAVVIFAFKISVTLTKQNTSQ